MSRIAKFILVLLCLAVPGSLLADGHGSNRCGNLPGHAALQQALEAAVAAEASGLDFEMSAASWIATVSCAKWLFLAQTADRSGPEAV